MLAKSDWNCLAKRVLHSMDSGDRELYDDTFETPIANYVDEGRWRREVDRVFKQRPVMVAFSCELAEANSFLALERVGVPILLTRGQDGKMRGFLNKCRHRGALLTGESEACGTARRFTCPYHAWTFSNEGRLVGVPARSEFGHLPDAYKTLIEIAVAERAGLIWAILTPGMTIDLDGYLGEMAPVLDQAGFDTYHLFGRRTIPGPNWKIAMDGYIENYHFSALHRETFAQFLLDDHAIYDDAGAHCRFFFVHPKIGQLKDMPEDEWAASSFLQLGYYIFPNLVGAARQDADPEQQTFLFFQIWPGDRPERSVTHVTALTPVAKSDAAEREELDAFVDFSVGVVESEDYWVGNGIQKGIATMADSKFIFGRMERLCQHYQKAVNALVDESVIADAG